MRLLVVGWVLVWGVALSLLVDGAGWWFERLLWVMGVLLVAEGGARVWLTHKAKTGRTAPPTATQEEAHPIGGDRFLNAQDRPNQIHQRLREDVGD